ncbi:MAG: Mur ligase family protein, partial [Planctomycetota bacterium]
RTDGRRFLGEAFKRGASAFLLQRETRYGALPHLVLDAELSPTELARQAGIVAHLLAEEPSSRLWVGAVTGTNGKSTVVHLVESALQTAGIAAAGGGTLGLHVQGKEIAIPNTTPSADLLHDWLHRVQLDGGKAAIFEASSVGIEQQRLSGVQVDCAAWTNLSHDHLDMHGTMEAYAAAKAPLFLDLQTSATALLPSDPGILELCAESPARLLTWALDQKNGDATPADLRGSFRSTSDGLHLGIQGVLGDGEIQSRLIGAHNAENLLVAFGMMRIAGVPAGDACAALAACDAAPGRLQRIAPEFHAKLFVDYAHSPEALAHVLQALRTAFPESRIGAVFGAGGDRDREKRLPMGRAVANRADWCVVTSDNPRGEEPSAIAAAVLDGAKQGTCQAELQVDRRAAIHQALARLQPGDVLLVAGKGHETYQEIEGVRHPFDDRVVLQEEVACLA